MIISFFSNYLTHHQIPFCQSLLAHEDIEFHFISTIPMEEERKNGGWKQGDEYAYELKAYESEDAHQQALRLAKESHVVIIGSADEQYVKYRMKCAPCKLTLRYSERIYKGGRWRVLSPRGMVKRFLTYFRYFQKPLYMLCASAYTAGDLAMLGSYINRCFKWGYFPEVKKYTSAQELIESKEHSTILWAARFIDWKHPEVAVEVARRLKQQGYSFRLNMIGNGEEEEKIRQLIIENDLTDCVSLLGTMKPEQVRSQMEKHKIFIFTSDRNEGWGAVLNEAMNSCCAVVANSEIGSVPFLLKDGENGIVYSKGDVNTLVENVKLLLDNDEKSKSIGLNAYKTITELWSPDVAASRFIELCKELLSGRKKFFDEGPGSKAYIRVKKRSK